MDSVQWHESREPVAERPTDRVVEVPQRLDRLADGREVLVVGERDRFARYAHEQGDYPGYRGTCGICACELVLRMFGKKVNEASLVAHAIDHGLCQSSDDPDEAGGTRSSDRIQILADYGVEAHADRGRSLEDVAEKIEQGHGVILAVNSYTLNDVVAWPMYYWGTDHAIAATAVARDPRTGELLGVYVNDSSPGVGGRFIDAQRLTDCWLDVGGHFEVTASPYLKETS